MRTDTAEPRSLSGLIAWVVGLLDAIPYALVALFARVVVAHAFFVSGQTKVDGPKIGGEVMGIDFTVTIPTSIRETAFALFADEYKVPLLPSTLSTYLATFAEHLLPILLFVGLASRFSALGLLGMTMVIQVFVYPDAWWTVHAYWAGLLLVIIAQGPGALSLDHLLFRYASTVDPKLARPARA